MSKIVILSHWRVGSTNFKKTLEQITGQEFLNEPDFDKHKNTIQSMGFVKFLEKSRCKSMKCDFVKSQDYLNDIIDYADMVFLLLRKDIGAQVDSYYKLEGIKLTRYEIMRANKKMKGLVQLHPNHRILYYENIVDFLSKKEKN